MRLKLFLHRSSKFNHCINTFSKYIIAVLLKIFIDFRIKDIPKIFQFISLLPDGKGVSCFEDILILAAKELKKVLLA